MKRSICVALWAVLSVGLVSIARADLPSDVRAIVGDKIFTRGEIGVEIIRLSDSSGPSTTLFQHKAANALIPASNLKLITTAAAIQVLGADFQFKTMLAGRGNDIALIGDGDPTLGDVELLKKLGWGVDTVFKTWAEMLKQRGINEVRDVLVDDSIFDEVFAHSSWPLDQEHKRYQSQVAGLNLNLNCADFYLTTTGPGQTVDFRIDPPTNYVLVANTCVTGDRNAVWLSRQRNSNDIILRGETNVSNDAPVSVTIHDPTLFTANVLAETLSRNGVRVTGKVLRDRTVRASLAGAPATAPAERWTPLAIHSTPLMTVLNRANKDSKNLYAEALCKRMGAKVSGQSGSWENGTAAISTMLRDVGVPITEFSLDDGCGLSKKNQISPNAIARVLEHQFQSKDRQVYLNSLAIGGIDGTLEDRFKSTDLRGRVFGKSGYVLGVRSLSGYLKARDGQWYAFSILMNALPDGADAQAKLLQERIVQAIDGPRQSRMTDGR